MALLASNEQRRGTAVARKIDFSAAVQESLRRGRVAAMTRNEQRRYTGVVCKVDFGAAVQENLRCP